MLNFNLAPGKWRQLSPRHGSCWENIYFQPQQATVTVPPVHLFARYIPMKQINGFRNVGRMLNQGLNDVFIFWGTFMNLCLFEIFLHFDVPANTSHLLQSQRSAAVIWTLGLWDWPECTKQMLMTLSPRHFNNVLPLHLKSSVLMDKDVRIPNGCNSAILMNVLTFVTPGRHPDFSMLVLMVLEPDSLSYLWGVLCQYVENLKENVRIYLHRILY